MRKSLVISLLISAAIFYGCGSEESTETNSGYDYNRFAGVCPAVMQDIYFDANSGHFSNNAKVKVGSITACGLLLLDHPEAPKADNKTFLGWSEEPDGEIIEYIRPHGEQTFYAQWGNHSPTQTAITFDANGGKFENNDIKLTLSVNSGAVFKFDSIPLGLKVEDMHFAGWTKEKYDHFDDISKAPYNMRHSALVTEPVIYYAVWVKTPPKTIKFIFNAAFTDNETSKTAEVTPGTLVKFSQLVPEPIQTEYKFLGWRGSSDAMFINMAYYHSATLFSPIWDRPETRPAQIFAIDYIDDKGTEKLILNGINSDFPLTGHGTQLIADSSNTNGYNVTGSELFFDYFTYVNSYDGIGYTLTPQPIKYSEIQVTLTDGMIGDFINFYTSGTFSKASRSITIDEFDTAIELTETVLPFDIENSYINVGTRSYEFNAKDFSTLLSQISAKYPGAVSKQARNTKLVYLQKPDGEYIYWIQGTVVHYFKILPAGTTTRLFLSKRTMDKLLTEFNR